MCMKKVKLINHDCLPILMLLYIVLYIVLFEDILVSFSLHRLNCILDHCSYVHGLALLLLC